MYSAGGIRLVILDFDGVIVESNTIKDNAFQKIFSQFPEHAEDLWQFHKSNISVSRFAKFDFLLEKIGRTGDIDLKNNLLAEFSATSLELMRSVPFVKGAKDFLKEMSGKVPLYLASVTPINDLETILTHLQIRSLFTDIYGCPPWNKPDAIRDILKKENSNSINAVLIGDSYGDQRAAVETGIHFIGRNSGLGFEDPQPKIIIQDLSRLASILQIDQLN